METSATVSVMVNKTSFLVERDLVVRMRFDGDDKPIGPEIPDGWLADPDLSAVSGVPEKHWKVVNDAVVEMSASEKADVDAKELARAKGKAIQAVRSKTNNLVAAGFVHDGKTISLTIEDLMTLTVLMNADQSSFEKIVWPTVDGDFVELDTLGEFTTFARKASSGAFKHFGAARPIEESIRVATNVAAVEAVTDNR